MACADLDRARAEALARTTDGAVATDDWRAAFARTDVMAESLVKAWEKLKPQVPVCFSMHGTGEDAAVKRVRERLGIEPFDCMEDAVKAAVKAAR